MHPFPIVYTLFHDTAGAAGSVTYALRQQTNVDAKFEGQDLFSLNIKYWEKRFQQKMMNLRMHGVSGHPYNAVQAAFLGRVDTGDAVSLFRNRYASMGTSGSSYNRGLMQTARGFRTHINEKT